MVNSNKLTLIRSWIVLLGSRQTGSTFGRPPSLSVIDFSINQDELKKIPWGVYRKEPNLRSAH